MWEKFYINNKNKNYCHQGNAKCGRCETTISNRFILSLRWNYKTKTNFKVLCLHCIGKEPSIADCEEKILFNCYQKLPKDTIAWFPMPPQLASTKGLNTFQAATMPSEAEIIDNTVHAGRESFGISISEKRDKIPISEFQSEEIKLKNEERIKELDFKVKDVNTFFKTVEESKPLIEEKQFKQIE